MKFASVVMLFAALIGSAMATERPATSLSAARFSSDELRLPANYRSWVELSSHTAGIPKHQHKHLAGKLFVEPAAFEHFNKTGTWPNKTVIVLELRSGKLAKTSRRTCDVVGLEAAVKDDSHFPDPWTYYGIVYDETKRLEKEKPLDMMLAMGYPTLRAVINATPRAMQPALF